MHTIAWRELFFFGLTLITSKNLTTLLVVQFESHTLEVDHEGITDSYEIHNRPIWDWITSLLDDPYIAKDFEWDARRLFKFDGEKYERFIHEPWTADAWWDIQVWLSSLPIMIC